MRPRHRGKAWWEHQQQARESMWRLTLGIAALFMFAGLALGIGALIWGDGIRDNPPKWSNRAVTISPR